MFPASTPPPFFFFTGVCPNSSALNWLLVLNQHLFLLSLSLQPLVTTLQLQKKGCGGKSPRLEIASALLPGSQRRAGEKGVVSPLPPALRKNGGLLIPFLPCPQDWAACGAASSSTAHTESVRTTNKISIKLSFVSSLPCFLLWEDVRQGIKWLFRVQVAQA